MVKRAMPCSVSAACFDAAVSLRDDALRIAITVRPGSKKESIEDGPQGDRLLVRVNAAPVDGKANASVLRVLAQCLGATSPIKKRQLRIVHGHTGREKVVAIEALGVEEARTALVAHDAIAQDG